MPTPSPSADAVTTALVAATSNGPSTTDWITAVCAVLTVLITGGAAIYAIRQWGESRQARLDARHAEVERSQPYVGVFLEAASQTMQDVDVVVQNFGPTAATNVQFTFAGPFERSDAEPGYEEFTMPTIPYLAPGQQWRTWFDSGVTRAKTRLPTLYGGQVRYFGLGEDPRQHSVYLDFEPFAAKTWGTDPATLRDVVRTLGELASSIRSLKPTPSMSRSFRPRPGQPND